MGVLDDMLREIEQPTLTKRGNVLPFAEYSDGSTSLAVPRFLHDPFAAFSQLLARGGYKPGTEDAEGVELATQAAGGAMGGSMAAARPAGSLGAGGRVMAEEVVDWAKNAGVPVEKVKQASTGTTYVTVRDPHAAKGVPGSKVEVRVAPEDGHGGRALSRDQKPGNYFDTTVEPPISEFPSIMASRVNRGGELYGDPDAFFDVMKWRTSKSPDGQFLVSPDRAPSVQKLSKGVVEDGVRAIEGPDLSPDQLRLLSSGVPADLLGAIKQFEGFTPKATWDYQQNSNGYGTRAQSPGEVIDREEAERRLVREVANARAIVERHLPNADEGTKAALTSLTFNAGDKWARSGLGDALRAGDMETARRLFLEYNKAGGQVLPGLVSRRQAEASWIGRGAGASNLAAGGDLSAPASSPAPDEDRQPAANPARSPAEFQALAAQLLAEAGDPTSSADATKTRASDLDATKPADGGDSPFIRPRGINKRRMASILRARTS